jgi:uncharacterized protein YybS (DUF2232 family)
MKPEAISLLGGMLPVVVAAILLAFYFGKQGQNPFTAVEEYFRNSIAEAAKLYTKIGLAEMAEAVSQISDRFVYYFVRLIPGIAIATSVSQAAVCYGLARSILQRQLGQPADPSQPPLSLWYAPDTWVWGLIAALTLIVVPHETAHLVGWNLVIFFALVYLVQGTAIAEYYLAKARIKPFLRGLILAFVLAMPSIVFVIALGIVDVWGDLRKVRGPVPPAA